MYKRGTHLKFTRSLRSRCGIIEDGHSNNSRKIEKDDLMMGRKNVRRKWLTVRLSEEEETKLNKFYKQRQGAKYR